MNDAQNLAYLYDKVIMEINLDDEKPEKIIINLTSKALHYPFDSFNIGNASTMTEKA